MPICSSDWTWRGASAAAAGWTAGARRRGLQPLHIAADDPPVRAGAFHLGQVDAGLLGDAARQGGSENTIPSARGAGRSWLGAAAELGLAPHGLRRCRAALALALQPCDRRIDLHLLGPFRHQERLDHALVDGFHLHGRLVGLDLGDHVAALDRVADLHVPFGERPLLHGGRQRRHQHIDAHGASLERWARLSAWSSQLRPSNSPISMVRPSVSSRQRAFTDQPSGLERGR